MVKHDLITGVMLGVIVGLVFYANLAPHLTLITIIAVVFGAKLIDLK